MNNLLEQQLRFFTPKTERLSFHKQNQDHARDNIRPYITVKKNDGDFQSANQKNRQQVKRQRKFINRQIPVFLPQKQKGFLFTLGIIDRMSAKFAGKAAKFDKFSNLDGLFVAFPIRHIPGRRQYKYHHTETSITNDCFFPAKPGFTDPGKHLSQPIFLNRGLLQK